VDVSAPGAAVTTTDCGGCSTTSAGTPNYRAISGTSFATPNTAGVVALLLARYPTWTNQQIVDRLLATADDLGSPGRDDHYGYGRVNAYRALSGAAQTVSVPAADTLEPNNWLARAHFVASGKQYRPSNYPAGDADYFWIDAPRAGTVTVVVTPIVDTTRPLKSSLPFDPVLSLVRPDGTTAVTVDHTDPAVTEQASLAVAGGARTYIRVTNWYPNGNPLPYTLRATWTDTVAPGLLQTWPANGSVMAPVNATVAATFSEPMTSVRSDTLTARDALTGETLPATVGYDSSRNMVRLVPAEPWPADRDIVVRWSGITDWGGNPPAASGFTFHTAPGTVFWPWKQARVTGGRHEGYRIGAGGQILSVSSVTLSAPSQVPVVQRAELPNLPGRWLYVPSGAFAGTWLQESAAARLLGEQERQDLPELPRIWFSAGTHIGSTFTAGGGVATSKAYTLQRPSGANIGARAIINGVPYLAVVNGVWAGYWIRESAAAHRVGIHERLDFSPAPRLSFVAGTYESLIVADDGSTQPGVTATLRRTSGANAAAWAIVNGDAMFLVANGTFAGTWLPADRLQLAP
jgi:hypothetical protein